LKAPIFNKEVRKLTQYSVAFVNFRQKFGQEAGDTKLFPNPGDANGNTENEFGTCPNRVDEPLSAWSHLTQAGMLTGEKFVWPAVGYNGNVGGCGVGWSIIGAAPLNKISAVIDFEDTGYFPIYSYYLKNGETYAGKRYLRLFATYYEAKMLWGLENKLDDGVPSQSSGSIYSDTADDGNPCTPDGVAQDVDTYGEDYAYCYVAIYYGETPEQILTPK
jgi:hypothetical protein